MATAKDHYEAFSRCSGAAEEYQTETKGVVMATLAVAEMLACLAKLIDAMSAPTFANLGDKDKDNGCATSLSVDDGKP